MIRIRALNEEPLDDSSDDDIAVSEDVQLENQYYEALKYKNGRQNELAINALKQLLCNQKFVEITDDMKTHQFYSMKYAVLKNLAELYAEREGEHSVALQYFIQASEMDSGDITFMHKFGQMAMQMKQYLLTFGILDECLKRNPNHFPSMNSMLELLCLQENHFEAYGWAIHCWSIFGSRYQAAIDVIFDVRQMLAGSPILEKAWSVKFNDKNAKRSSKPSLFPQPVENIGMSPQSASTTLYGAPLQKNSWLSLGNLIKSIYDDFSRHGFDFGKVTTFEDIFSSNEIDGSSELELPMLEDQAMEESSNIESDIKKPIIDIFVKILPHYFQQNDIYAVRQQQKPQQNLIQPHRLHTGQSDQIKGFHKLMEHLKSGPFDGLDLVFNWLKFVSSLYQCKLSAELIDLYFIIFENHQTHLDLNTWSHLSVAKGNDLFQMTLFYIELKIASNANGESPLQFTFDASTTRLLFHLLFMRRIFGFAETKSNDENMQLFAHLNLRLHLLHYQYAMQTQDLELANSLLKKVKLILSKLPNKMGEMYLSNQKHFNHINIDVIKKEESMVDCHLLVKDVENYYANEQYDAVIPVLLKFRKNSFESPELSKMVQVEVLLESFWMTNQYVKCMKLAEETLYNNIETWMWRDANDRNVSKKIRYHIKFILIYLKDLLQDDYQLVALFDKKNRLLQSIAQLLEIQFSPKHAVRQRGLFKSDDLLQIVHCILKTDSNDAALINEMFWMIIVEISDLIIVNSMPNSDNGCFLLFAFNQLASLDVHTKHMYLASIQRITHVLYGYPKQLENHSVCNCNHFELSCESASQLFGLFETLPDNLRLKQQWEGFMNITKDIIPFEAKEILDRASGNLLEFIKDRSDFPNKIVPVENVLPVEMRNLFYYLSVWKKQENIGAIDEDIEKYAIMDLSLNPSRSDSWLILAEMNVHHLERIYRDTADCNPINLANLIASIEVCFDKCRELDGKNTAFMFQYALYTYRIYSNLRSGQFGVFFPPKKSNEYLLDAEKSFTNLRKSIDLIEPKQQWICFYLLGKTIEKQKKFTTPQTFIELYLQAAAKLELLKSDISYSNLQCEIKFRIAASIYKYVRQDGIKQIDQEIATFLVNTLIQFAPPLEVQPIDQPSTSKLDVNSNEIIANGCNQIEGIIELCIRCLETCLREQPSFYKAKYFLAKIYLHSPQPIGNMDKCHNSLLRSNGNQRGLFWVHRSRQLFNSIVPSASTISVFGYSSYYKYMEKSVLILVEYLERKSDHYLFIVLIQHWLSLLTNRVILNLQQNQKERLFVHISNSFNRVIERYINELKRASSKTKRFTSMFQSIFEIYKKLAESNLDRSIYANLLRKFYGIDTDAVANGETEADQLENICDYCKSTFPLVEENAGEEAQEAAPAKKSKPKEKLKKNKLSISHKSNAIRKNKIDRKLELPNINEI